MPDTYFHQQDEFLARMISDYHNGNFPEVDSFQSYFDWKEGIIGLRDLPQAEARDMLDICQQLLADYYEHHPDAEAKPSRVSYLEAIDDELSTILPILQ